MLAHWTGSPLHVVQTLVRVSEVPFPNPPATPSPEADNWVIFAEMSTILILGIPEENTWQSG